MVAAGGGNETKAEAIFGNLDQIYSLHAQHLLPRLESCNSNSDLVARYGVC